MKTNNAVALQVCKQALERHTSVKDLLALSRGLYFV